MMKRHGLAALLMCAAGMTAAPGEVSAQPAPATSASARNDYANPATWLCGPGRQDACAVDEDATIVRADGTAAANPYKPAADPKIDCFYVYPTVSREKTANADMAAGPEELLVIKQQFARFGSVCRPYAPIYRQVTLTALFARMTGHPIASDSALAYHDVKDAWDYYLSHDNHGRGVVLIGHSQGSGILIQLVKNDKNDIDERPVQSRIVSIILGGARLQVPAGKVVGGGLQVDPPLPGAGSDWMRHQLRFVPGDQPAAVRQPVRGRRGARPGGGVREPGGPLRRQRRPAPLSRQRCGDDRRRRRHAAPPLDRPADADRHPLRRSARTAHRRMRQDARRQDLPLHRRQPEPVRQAHHDVGGRCRGGRRAS